MDPSTLVAGGADGLHALTCAFREDGFPVQATYLVKRRSLEDEESYWVIVLVVSPFGPEDRGNAILSYATLQRAGRIPVIAPEVRLDVVSSDHIEASRLLAYARRRGTPPVVLKNVGTEGLLIDYALVADDQGSAARAA